MKNFEHLTGVERKQLFRMAMARTGDSHLASDLLDKLDPSLSYYETKRELAQLTGGSMVEEAPDEAEAKYLNEMANYAAEQMEKKQVEAKREPKAEREPDSKESVSREERRHKLMIERMKMRQQFKEREASKQRKFEAIKGVAGYAGKMFSQSIAKHRQGSFMRPNAGILPQRGTAPIQGAPRGWVVERGLVQYPRYSNGVIAAPSLLNKNGMDVFTYYRQLQGQNPMLASGSPFRKSVGAAQFRGGNVFGGTGVPQNVFIPHSTPQGRGVSRFNPLSPRSQRARASNPFGLKHSSKRFRWL